jgi:hypothetical protein
MSDTPRTDEARRQYQAAIRQGRDATTIETVDIEFARELERELNELKARHKTAILECTQYTPESWAAACEHEEPCAVWLDGAQMTQLMKDKAERDKTL